MVAENLLSDAAAAQHILSGSDPLPDVLNINNAYVAGMLYPEGRVRRLEERLFQEADRAIHPDFAALAGWAFDKEQRWRIGIVQRFGPFNLVINRRMVSKRTAEDEGFNLFMEAAFQNRYGILRYDDFNLFHICIAAGLNPFTTLDNVARDRFENVCRSWFAHAAIVSDDHFVLNRALVDGRIAFYLSGGTYTVSPARLEGHHHVEAVTPRSGPIEGKGGIVFTEVTCLPSRTRPHALGEAFLQFLLEPESAYRAAITPRTCNPVLQMGATDVFSRFSKQQLDAIQWDGLAEAVSYCAHYELVPNQAELIGILNTVAGQTTGRGA